MNRQPIEIDLFDLLKKITKSWYLILISMLIFGIAFPVGRWKLNIRNYNVAHAEKQNVSENAEDLENNLSEDEKIQIDQCRALYRRILQNENYLSESALMQVDPYNAPEVILQFVLSSQDNIQQIKEAYSAYIANQGYTESVVKAINWEGSASYLAELISLGNAYTNTQDADTNVSLVMPDSEGEGGSQEKSPKLETLIVKIIGRDDKEADQIAMAVRQCLEDYSAMVENFYGEHSITLVNTYESYILDTGLASKINSTNDQLTNAQNSLKTLEDKLTDDQKKVWDSTQENISNSVEEEAVSSSSISVSDEKPSSQSDTIEQPPTVSKKDIVIGLLFGLVFAVLCLAFRYILAGKIHTVNDARTIYQKPVLGTFTKKSLWASEKEILLATIRLACKNEDISRLVLASSLTFSGEEKKLLEQVADEFGKEIQHSYKENVLGSPEAIRVIGDTGAVIFCEKLEVTKRDAAYAEARLCRELDFKCVGTIILQ